jgi:hypothetical protein
VFSNSAWNESHEFTYDDTNQLIAADHSVQDNEAYAYNRTVPKCDRGQQRSE